MTSAANAAPARLRLGTAPDSWGVWFPDEPSQVPWHRFLDEAVAAGYEWIELGPYGYLPTDPEQLRDELGKRGLRLSGGAVFSALHKGKGALDSAIAECRTEAALLTALGARYLVSLPEGYTDLDGNLTQPATLTAEQWDDLTSGMNELSRVLLEEHDVQLVFHPHADSHVDTQPNVVRFLENTDPSVVQLCLDTGHISYCGGDNIEIIRAFPDRMGYIHLKQVDPQIVRQVEQEQLCFAEAVRRGAMIEPPEGVPAMEPLLAELASLDIDLFAIVEQDMYPCPPEQPYPIALRTREFFNGCGVGPMARG
jgi:inosose dehydratase